MNPFPTLPSPPDLAGALLNGVNLSVGAAYALVFVACLLGNTFIVGFFLPAGTVAAVCGFLARRGMLDVSWVIAAVWAGMVVGYNFDYCIGRFLLARVADWSAATRLGRWIQLESRLERGGTFLDRHGDKAILYAYAGLGHFRSIVAVSIGMARLSYWRFLLYQLVASLLWSLIYVSLGYYIGLETNTLSGAAVRISAMAAGIFLGVYIAWALVSALTGEFYDPLIGRISFHRRKSSPAEDASNGLERGPKIITTSWDPRIGDE